MDETTLNIFLVEDNYGDERLVREALLESNHGTRLNVVNDGIEALAYLRREGGHRGAVRPDVILLDLNIPRKSGAQVLAEIRRDPDLTSIPVLVLTTSDSHKDRAQCLDLKADDYIRKPVDLNDFLNLIRMKEDHWRNELFRCPPRFGGDGFSGQIHAAS